MKNEIDKIEILFDNLYPICRSIMGEGQRKTLDILEYYLPLERVKFNTGQKVLNWEIPREWVIREAWIKDSFGNDIINFKQNNLYVVNYSCCVDKIVTLKDLENNLYYIKDLPKAIPYVTSYYKERWGFCIEYENYKKLQEQDYHVYIDSEYIDGTLEIGHCKLKGESDKEILLSSYICHPSMANNELSGPIVLAFLYNKIKSWSKRRFTYRFIINPETIGSIAYLSKYGDEMKQDLYSGLVLTCLGGDECLSYKKSRKNDTPINEIINHLIKHNVIECKIREFTPTSGSDERQYCSPGFNLPIGQVARKTYDTYKEYHTSLDNKELMGIENLVRSIDEIELILKSLEYDGYYINKYPYGEIKLDQYNLYPDMNSYFTSTYSSSKKIDGRLELNCILNILNYSDGKHKMSFISDICGISILDIKPIIDKLINKGLIEGPFYEERGI